MTVREAMREPITLQALICLVAGLFMGVAAMLIPTVIAAAVMEPRINCETTQR